MSLIAKVTSYCKQTLMRRHYGGELIELDGDEVMCRWDQLIRSTPNDGWTHCIGCSITVGRKRKDPLNQEFQ